MSDSPPKIRPRLKAPRGTTDVLPETVHRWRRLEEEARRLFGIYGYREVRTPILEHTPLFVRSIGEVTDIVEKEMYTLGEGENSLTLRPEGTAPVVRAYLEHGYHQRARFQKWFYIGPMFRRERPQAGRQRQFHQIGVEVLGSQDPLLDVEVMGLACEIFRAVGLAGFVLAVNTIGCPSCRSRYRRVLRERLAPLLPSFCPNCQRRFERNIFRLLDCKEEQCRNLCADLPPMSDHLCEECNRHWRRVREGLDQHGPEHTVDPRLVRGFDYYTRTVFEVRHPALGARDAICGGGRYDNLIASLGGPDLGALGFAIGVEATLLAAERTGALPVETASPPVAVYVATTSDDLRDRAYRLLTDLRRGGVSADMDHEGRSLRKQLRAANALGCPIALILGPEEAERESIRVKLMRTGEETLLTQSDLLDEVRRLLTQEEGKTDPQER